MNAFCPNLSNSLIKKEFDELIDVFGENTAYFLWNKNEGYSIDRTPEGVRSPLFLHYIKKFNGSRTDALKATAKDLINGKTHGDVEYIPLSKHPLEDIKETIEQIGLYDLIDTLVSKGVDSKLAKAIYNTARKTKPLQKLKPIDVYSILSQTRDASLKDDYNKRILAPINKELEKHLVSILYSYGFEIKDLGDLIVNDPSITLENISAAYDIFNKIIYVSKHRNEITMPEEFAHAFIKMMGTSSSKRFIEKNGLSDVYMQLYNLVENVDIYRQVYEKYKNVYVYTNRDGSKTPNKRKIKEEAIGQALAVLIINKWNLEHSSKSKNEKSFFEKLKDFVNRILDKFTKKILNEEDLPENINLIEFENILGEVANRIIKNNMSDLNHVDDSNYSMLKYDETIYNQNQKDGGTALNFMLKFTELGCSITGSLSYRLLGTIYRLSKDSLHDIDVTVPFNIHQQTPFAYWFLSIEKNAKEELKPLWETPENKRDEEWKQKVGELADKYSDERLEYLLSTTDFFKKIKQEYPDMLFTTAYSSNKLDGIVVSAVWSFDYSLSERFNLMRGSYADRLNLFTEEERSKIYLFDFFLILDDNVDSVFDKENKLSLTSFDTSFLKKLQMGRKKDLFDYQRWLVFENYKNIYQPTTEGLMFLDTTPFVSEEYDVINSQEEYVVQNLSEFMKNNPDADDVEINIKRREFINEYVQKRQREIMSDTALKLADAFGLVKQADGTWMTHNTDPVSKLRVEFVNKLDEEHAGQYEYNPLSLNVHHIIRIGLDKGDPTTFSHELAHYYIRMFRNSKVIQEALKMVNEEWMTDDQREEALVNKLVEITIENMYGNIFENKNIFHIVWNNIANMLYNIFNIKTKSIRNSIINNAAIAFQLNEQLSAIEDERLMFNISNNVKYQSKAVNKFRSRKQEQLNKLYSTTLLTSEGSLTQDIIRHTENKDKAYSRRGGTNEQQLIRLLEAVYSVHQSEKRIKEAIAANRIADEFHEKAELIINYMDRAVYEIADSVRAFLSAMANNYRQFVYNINPDGTIVYTAQGSNNKNITFDDLINIKSDILNFHANIIGNIGKMLSDVSNMSKFSTEDIDRIRDKYNTLLLAEQISKFENMFNNALDKACIRDIILYIDENVPLNDDLKTRLKINMLKWLRDQNDFGDVSIYEQWVGLGSHSKSPIIRMMQDIINDLQYEIDTPTEKVGKDLVKLLNDARKSTTKGFFDISKYNIKIGKINISTPWDIQKLFMEKLSNGLFSGNLISNINRGQYFKNKEDFLAELLFGKDGKGGIEKEILTFSINNTTPYKDFELYLDKYQQPIFPEDSALEDICKKYYRELEKWRCANEDRLYTEKYYEDRINTLSVKTLRALDEIQQRVGEIYSVCTINGIVRTDLLTSSLRLELANLRLKRALLYNFYNEDGTLKPDGSDEKQIAEELAVWSMKTHDKIKYKIDYDKYNEALRLSRNKLAFLVENTETVINPKVWEYYNRIMQSNIPKNSTDPDIEKLNKLIYVRNKMLSGIKANGFGFTNMSEIWDELNKQLKKKEFWKNLRSIETSIHRLRSTINDRYRSSSKLLNKTLFTKVFNTIYNPINEQGPWFGNNVPRWLNHLHVNLRTTSPLDVKLLYLENSQEPLSIFSTLVPVYKEENGRYVLTNELGQKYDIFIKIPNSNFSVLDVDNSDAEYVNKNYQNDNNKTYQPKETVYKNKDFEIIENNQQLKDLYDKLLSTMQESWARFPFLKDYDFRLPQMRGRTGQILGRKRNIFKNIGYLFSSWWEINETDEWYNNDYQTRPDGSRIDFVPIRFIKRLDRPEYISSDVVGSVIQFYQMAKNFEIKSKAVSHIETYLTKFELNDLNKNRSWSDVSQSQILSHMADVQMYGREQDVTISHKKEDLLGNNRVKFWLKRVKASRGWALASLLAHNYASAIVSFLDPFLSLTLDMLTGKYTNYRDFFYALGVMGSDIFRATGSLGSVRTYSKANAAMLYFQLGKSNSATFKNLDKSQFYRFFSDNLGMKPFSLGDYTISCITMISTMNNYKLYEYKDNTEQNPHKKFLKKDEFIKEAIADGRTEEEAYDMYNQWFGATSLWEAFELKDGRFLIKRQFENIIDTRLMKNVRKQVSSRSSVYNGVVPDLEKTRLLTNIWTSFLTMLRNFFIMGINERFKTQRDFQVVDYDQYNNLRLNIENGELINSTPENIVKTKKEESYLKGGWNFSTRTIEDGVFTGFGDVLRNMYGHIKYYTGYIARSQQENEDVKEDIYKLSEFDKYACKKVTFELLTIASLLIFATYMNGKADEDKDDYMKQLLALIFTRLPSERITFYSPTLISDLITSPTSAVSAYRRFLRILNLSTDLIGLSDYSINDDVKYGSYAGQKRWLRDVCGIFSNYGLHNAYTNTNAKSLREKNKYYNKLLPVGTKNIDAIIELFGIDLMLDKTNSSNRSGMFSDPFESSFNDDQFGTSF